MGHFFRTGSPAISALVLAVAGLTAPTPAMADSDPYIGEIMPTGINFCPRGWAEANGQLLPISQNDALYSLYGTIYGGDGRTTFGLPDLRGRIPTHAGTGPGLPTRTIGQKGGQEQTTLTLNQLASHSHAVNATNADGDKPGPGDKILAAAPTGGTGNETIYSEQPANVQMSSEMIASTGGGQPFPTTDPTLVIRYCVALVGVYPSRN